MIDRDIPPSDSVSVLTPPKRRRGPVEAVIAFVTGFLAVLLLGLGVIVWFAPRATVNLTIGFDELGSWAVVTLHRFGLGAVLFGLGVWFTLLTRGLWHSRKYGRVLGWITLGVIAAIAIMGAVT